MKPINARNEARKILTSVNPDDKAAIKKAIVKLQNKTSLPRNRARSIIQSEVRAIRSDPETWQEVAAEAA